MSFSAALPLVTVFYLYCGVLLVWFYCMFLFCFSYPSLGCFSDAMAWIGLPSSLFGSYYALHFYFHYCFLVHVHIHAYGSSWESYSFLKGRSYGHSTAYLGLRPAMLNVRTFFCRGCNPIFVWPFLRWFWRLAIKLLVAGFYETRIAYYSWRGATGYRFASIPGY